MAKRQNRKNEENGMEERVLHIRRVSKKTTGGNYVSFSALVAVGDGKGNVGVGLGRGLEVPPAIKKAISKAKKSMVNIPIYKDSLPHEIKIKYKSSVLLLKPAPRGTGLKLGGVVRTVFDIAGVNNASGKIMGTRNQVTNAYAVIEAIKKLKSRIKAEDVVENKEEESTDKKPEAPKEEKKDVKKSLASAEKKEVKSSEKEAPKKEKKAKAPAKKTTKKKVVKKSDKKV